ncbi:efflux transporter outer membrane subunit [Erwiniaceae bacterium BAC15a-03b]|uniref:Efflux transporter outer membrane subunit n=1 Tax=Winslowiella arboricola TaxID=2978220 RepID=A0A9J6PT91_9GAMM|nr:efflux transporter outer membrane subunit [Winslowiella arboricola]MCU5774634.1 efflux transporter outer membrane subunit [Winslowiella arboricola]MCU5777956.1 efflux transporter outer membrane subunit [Winslowiella arboricola]
MIKTTLSLAIGILLAGCSLQPDYQQPTLPVDSQYHAAAAQQAGNGADIAWQNFFTDPVMKQLISLALENNRDLRVAALNVDVARSQVQIDRAALLPTVSLSGSETAQHLPGNLYSTKSSGPVTYHQFDTSLGVTSWELDFFGRLRSLRDQALESYLATDATQRATRISLISEVASGYLSLCADNALLKLAQQTVQSQQASYDLTKRSFDAGVSSDQELAQAETSVRSAQADVASYTRQVRKDVNALTLLAGTRLPSGLLANAELEKAWSFPATPAGLPSDLLTRRPDIISAEHTLKAANANIGAARAAFFPSISLTASGGSSSNSLGHLLEGGTAAWSFGPSVNLPIFDGGVNQANLDVARLQKRIEVANYEKAIQTAFEEVGDALAGEDTWKAELQARQQDLAANQRYYHYAEIRFQQGVDNYLNVLVAQRSLYSAQQAAISAQLGQLNQQVTLYKALGGGWKS